MTYILILFVLIIVGSICFYFVGKKPQLIPIGNPAGLAPNPLTTSQDINSTTLTNSEISILTQLDEQRQASFANWQNIVVQALDHIYDTNNAEPTLEAVNNTDTQSLPFPFSAIRKLLLAFERLGTLHSSLTAVDSPDISIKEVGDMITRDPLLSAQVLKVANSPLFRTTYNIKSIYTAVNILGLTNLKNLIALNTMPYNLYNTAKRRTMFKAIWQHLNNTAITAAHMARTLGLDSGTAYTVGLLHDVGKLLLILLIKENSQEDTYPLTISQEQELTGATHLQVTDIMADKVSIPNSLIFLIINHHLPESLPLRQLECSAEQAMYLVLIFLANQIAKLISAEGTLHDDVSQLSRLEPSYQEIISKERATQILLSPGLMKNILDNVRLVHDTLG